VINLKVILLYRVAAYIVWIVNAKQGCWASILQSSNSSLLL